MTNEMGSAFPTREIAGALIAGFGSLGMITQVEAAEATKMNADQLREGTRIFTQYATNQAFKDTLKELNRAPSSEAKLAAMPAALVATYLGSATHLKDCGVINIQVGILLATKGSAKVVMRFNTNRKHETGKLKGQTIYYELEAPMTKE